MLNRLPPRRALLLGVLVATAAGGALGLAYQPYNLPWLVLLSVPALLAALDGTSMRGGALVGAAFGITWYAVLVPWLSVIGGDAAIALAVVEGLFYAVFGALASPAMRIRGWQLWVPALWVATEYATASVPFGGFPWGRLAWAFAGAEPGHYVAWFGVPGLSFVLALIGTLLYAAIRPRAGRGSGSLLRRLAPVAVVVAILGVAFAVPTPDTGSGRDVTVAMVQGNVPGKGMDFLGQARTVTRNHLAATEELAAEVAAGRQPKPELVIWPENSTDIDPQRYPPVYQTISAAVQAINRPVLVGAVLDDPVRNAGQLWLPGRGPVAIYVKRKLVPFGEVIPFRGILSRFISLIKYQPRDFTPGGKAVVFRVGKIRLGDVICYEVSFDDLVQSEVSAGANLLAVQTNDASFEVDGQTGETLQQLDMARIRAVEYDRAVVVASTSGVSAIVMPDGSLSQTTGTWVQAELVARVPLRTYRTLASRVGDWPEYVLTLAALVALAWALAVTVAGRRARERRGTPAAPVTPPA